VVPGVGRRPTGIEKDLAILNILGNLANLFHISILKIGDISGTYPKAVTCTKY
jgi:hypothetical protein